MSLPWDLPAYQALIKQRCGLLFEDDDRSKLTAALQQRSQQLQLPPAAYYRLLSNNPAEFQQLVNLLTINETYFFREPQQIDWLVQHLAPRLLARSEGQTPLRILSAGCSSGEEPYSIAIALLEKYGVSTARLFTLLAGDIDSNMLLKAQAGRYAEFSFRGLPEALRQRYFSANGNSYHINDEVRQLVQFQPLNLLTEHFDPALHNCDVIFLRNVTIYFDSDTRKQIQRNLAKLLRTNGILVIGMAETLANDLGVLPMAQEQGLYYFYQGAAPASSQPLSQALSQSLSQPPQPTASASKPAPASSGAAIAPLVPPQGWAQPASTPAAATASADLPALRQAVRDKQYAQALPQLNALLEQHPQHTEALLLKAHILLERQDFAATQALAEQVLAQDEWACDAWLLYGLAAKWQGAVSEAIRSFKQAIYAQPGCWPAQYFLAEQQRSSGALEPARRGYRAVLQLLSTGDAATGLRYVPLDLPASQIRFLCQHQLNQLDQQRPLPQREAG